MSKNVEIKTQVNDRDILSKTLETLNVPHKVKESNGVVKDWYGNTVTNKADIVISDLVGFARDNEGNYKLVGDLHYETKLLNRFKRQGVTDSKSFVDKIEQVYKIVNVQSALEQSGYSVVVDFSNIDSATELTATAEVEV